MYEEVMIGILPGAGYSARILVHDPVRNTYSEERVPVEYWKINQISPKQLEIIGITTEDHVDSKEEKDLKEFEGFIGYTSYPSIGVSSSTSSTVEETSSATEEVLPSPQEEAAEESTSESSMVEEKEFAGLDGEVKGDEEVKKSSLEADTTVTKEPEDNKLVGIREASEITGVEPYQLRYAVRHNNLEGEKKNNRWVFNKKKLVLWREDQEQQEKDNVPRRGRRRRTTA